MRINPISDPYLRDRLTLPALSNENRGWKWFLIAILFISGLVAVGYLFPQSLSPAKDFWHRQIDYWKTISFDSQEPSQPIEKKVISEESKAVSLSLPPEKAALSSTKNQEPPSPNGKKPIAKETATLPTAQVSVPTKETAETPEELLIKAKAQLLRKRLTSPAGDNAFETYQALEKIAPEPAQQILGEIVGWYLEQGKKYFERGRLIAPEENNAYAMYQKIQAIAPQHPQVQKFLEDMMTTLDAQAAQYLRNNQLIEPTDNNAVAICQALLTIAPEHRITQSLLEEVTQQLFERANQQVAQRKYTTPENDNAASTYQKILLLSPTHPIAQHGIDKIVEEYHTLALARRKLGQYAVSLQLIERGLQVRPNDSTLLLLKEQIAKEQEK